MTRTSTSMRGKSASIFPTPGTDRLLSTSTKSKRRFDVKGLKTSPELEGVVDDATVLNSGDDCFVNMFFASDTHSRSFVPKKHERKGLVEEANELGAHQAQGIARDLYHLCVYARIHSCVLIVYIYDVHMASIILIYLSTSVLGTGTMNNKSVQQDDGQQLHQRLKDRKAASTNSSSSFESQHQQEARPITTDSNNQQLMSQVLEMQRKLELLSETNSRLRQELGQQRTTINDDFYQRKRNFGSMQESSSGAEPKLQQQYYYRGDSESTVNDDQMHLNEDVHSHHECNRKDRRFRYYYGGTTRR